jgi:hypothetical protein
VANCRVPCFDTKNSVQTKRDNVFTWPMAPPSPSATGVRRNRIASRAPDGVEKRDTAERFGSISPAKKRGAFACEKPVDGAP